MKSPIQKLLNGKTNIRKSNVYFQSKRKLRRKYKDIETLTIDFESSLGLDFDEDGYFVLKTDGWSVDSIEDLQEIFNRTKRVVFSSYDAPPNEALFNAAKKYKDKH